MSARLNALAVLLALTGLTARAEDWPQFRGPTGQGHSSEQGLPLEWSESRNIQWKTPVPGQGWSSPVVSGGRAFLTSAVPDATGTSLRLLAFEIETGREVVNTEIFRLNKGTPNLKNSHASPVPSSMGTASTSTSAPTAPRRSRPLANGSGACVCPTSRSTATAAPPSSSATC